MRISLSGASGTGKTTLGRFLGEHTSLTYLAETEERVAVEMGYRDTGHLRQERGCDGLIENFFLSLEKKVEEEKSMDNYVTDKSIFDVGARWFGRLWNGIDSKHHDMIRRVMRDFAQQRVYDRVFYLPLDLTRAVEDDGLRSTGEEIRYQRSLLIQGLLTEHGVPFTPYDFRFSDPPEKVLKDLGLEKYRAS